MIILGTNSIKDTGFDVANSLRFNVGSTDHLDRSQSTGNQKTYTVSFWIKRGVTGGQEYIVSARYGNSSRYQYIRWNGDNNSDKDCLDIFSGIYSTSSTSTSMAFKTNRKFRDVSAWYHIVLAVDTTQGTESNRVKIYVNGVQETSFATATYPSQNQDHFFNINTTPNEIGAQNSSSTLGSYLSEVVLIDGSQLAADQFGEFDEDSGIWKPIDVSGLTFGTNGFYLQFKESGTSANSSGLGADTSGNNHHFTVSNLTAIDQSTDTCTNNFCTMNPLAASSYSTLSEGNTQTKGNSGADNGNVISTFAPSNGKWYCECLVQTGKPTGYPSVGLAQVSDANFGTVLNSTVGTAGYNSAQSGVIRPDGQRYSNNSTASWTVTTYDTNDILMMAMDCDNGAFYIGKNGTWMNSGNPNSGSSRTNAFLTWTPASQEGQAFATRDYNGSVLQWNFGSPAFAISSGNTDGDGYGNFEYAVPSGYFSLNTKNLAEYG